jgi:Cohesin domain/SprB repeat/Secretion system C-terminal sorting domain
VQIRRRLSFAADQQLPFFMKINRLIWSVFGLFLCQFLRAQSTDCFSMSLENASGTVGDTICMSIRVNNFTEIASAQFGMRWNPAVLQFQNVQDGALNLDLNQAFGTTYVSEGLLYFSWFDPTFVGQTLADDDPLFSVCFKIIGNLGSFSTVSMGNVPIPVEFTNPNFQFFTPNLFQSTVTVTDSPQIFSPILMKGCVKNMVCAGANGEIALAVTGGQPPYSFSWSGPNGFISSLEDLQNLQPGTYNISTQDAAGQVKKANFLVENTNFATFSLKLTPKNATCPIKTDGEINLEILGPNQPPLTFLWSNGATSQNISGLAEGIFAVTVTDTSSCDLIMQTKIEESAGFEANLVVQNPNCLVGDSLGSISASILATTASAPFTFLWSNGGIDSVISSKLPGEYFVTVTELGGCSTVVSAIISDDLLVDWQVSLATDCQPNSSLGNIEAYLVNAVGGLAPFTFSWSNGTIEIIDSVQNLPIKSTLTSVESAIYELKISDATSCDFVIKDIVLGCKKPVNSTQSCFTFRGGAVAAPDSTEICVPFFVENMDSISGYQFGLIWDTTQLQFSKVLNDPPPPNNGSSFNPLYPNMLRNLRFDFPLSDPNGTKVLEVCFFPKGLPDSSATISFVSFDIFPPFTLEVIKEINNMSVSIPFQAQNARVSFSPTPPIDLKLEFCTILPDCANDGKADIDLTVSGGNPPYIFSWTSSNGLSTSTEDLSKINTGTYFILVTDFLGIECSGIVSISNIINATSDCVWPGDADNNATVNHFDLLTLGLGLGNEGPPRTTAGTIWTGYNSPNWATETPVSNVNFQHLDMNGGGTISTADVDVLNQNWGETIFTITEDPNLQPPDFQSVINGNGPVLVVIPSDTLEAGTAAEIPVWIGLPDAPAVDLYGVAFSIFYDTTKFQAASINFQPTGSWLGQLGDNLLFVQKNFPEKGRLDIAITRTDGENLTGFGEIGLAYVIIEEDIYLRGDDPYRGTMDTIVATQFEISHVRGITNDEKLLDLQAKNPPFYLHAEIISTKEPTDLSRKINVFPNPVSEEITFQSAILIKKVRIFGADGHVFGEKIINSKSTSFSVDFLPSGFYFLEILTENGVVVKRVFVK